MKKLNLELKSKKEELDEIKKISEKTNKNMEEFLIKHLGPDYRYEILRKAVDAYELLLQEALDAQRRRYVQMSN